MRRPWVSVGELIEQGSSAGLSSLIRQHRAAQPDQEKPPEVPGVAKSDDPKSIQWQSARVPAKRPEGKKVSKKARKKAAAAERKMAQGKKKLAAPEPGVVGSGPPHSMGEIKHESQSLVSRVRPDLPPAHERHKEFDDAYHHERAKTSEIHHQGTSINAVFRGETHGGHTYWAKPHGGALAAVRSRGVNVKPGAFEPEEWHNRHDASYRVMAAMGVHHMGVPGLGTKMHEHSQMPLDAPHPAASDDIGKRLSMPRHHAGQPSLVTQDAGSVIEAGHATRRQLDGVDHEHRLHGIINHVLFGSTDGHRGNVMIDKVHGHPVIIDNDLALASKHSQSAARAEGKKAVRSIFAPGGMLDYTHNRPANKDGSKEVGSEYPPRMKSTLRWLADGGHLEGKGKMSLSGDDGKALQDNATDLLSHGLEGTLKRRSVRHK